MLLADWRQQTIRARAQQHDRMLCVTLPFLTIPGVMEQLFPRAQISYISLTPRPEVVSPVLNPGKDPLGNL